MSAFPRYIKFDNYDKIISIHKTHVNALHACSRDINLDYIDTEEYDISSLFSPDQIVKGARLEGLTKFVRAIREELHLTELMAKYLNKEYVMLKEGEKAEEWMVLGRQETHDDLLRELNRFDTDFDLWVEQYTEKGKALKQEKDTVKLEAAEKKSLELAQLEKAENHFTGACFSLPAIAGKMGDSIYYTVQVPMAQVPQLFKFNQEEVPVHLRAQRVLNSKRVSALADYMESRQSDYTLPALTASVNESMRFEPVEGFANLGMVQIPIGATMLINDGQHRAASIEDILKRCPSFKDQSVSVVLFYDKGLVRSQQMFADINDKMVKPPKALNILFDKKNKLNRLVIDTIDLVDMKPAVEFEKTNPASKSRKVWSVSTIKKSIEIITGLNDKRAQDLDEAEYLEYQGILVAWFNAIFDFVGGLSSAVFCGNSTMLSEMRQDTVCTHAVFLQALALASKELVNFNQIHKTDFSLLKRLEGVSMQKENFIWKERIVNADGTMNITASGIKLGAFIMLEKMGTEIINMPDQILRINEMVFSRD